MLPGFLNPLLLTDKMVAYSTRNDQPVISVAVNFL